MRQKRVEELQDYFEMLVLDSGLQRAEAHRLYEEKMALYKTNFVFAKHFDRSALTEEIRNFQHWRFYLFDKY